ncbi:MAG: hypothetical protein ACREIF_16530 [Chthoniobacterales bacterium]
MTTFYKALLLVTSITILSARLGCAEPDAGFEISTAWNKGVSQTQLTTHYAVQRSGVLGDTTISTQCEGLIQEVTGSNGKPVAILSNASRTIVGFNLRPATEVNQIYMVVKAKNDQLRVYENLILILLPALTSKHRQFTEDDRDVFFITNVRDNCVTIQYRGPKIINPPIHPFEVQFYVSVNGDLNLRAGSFKQLHAEKTKIRGNSGEPFLHDSRAGLALILRTVSKGPIPLV